MKFVKKQTQVACFMVFIANCGISADASQQAPSLGSGIAPYEESDRVELCLEGAALQGPVTSSDIPLGLCVLQSQRAQSCTEDTECSGREACVCGRCVLELCEFSSECAQGSVCVGSPSRCAPRCFDESDCPASHLCEQGACIPSCGDESDCAFGELCLVGQCVALGCGHGPGICSSSERCDLQRSFGTLSKASVKEANDQLLLYAVLSDAQQNTVLVRGIAMHATRFDLEATEGLDSQVFASDSGLAFNFSDSQVEIYYAKAGEHALFQNQSSDGLLFSEEQIVLEPYTPWQGSRLLSPAVLRVNQETWLFYLSEDKHYLGLARFDNAGSVVRIEDPVLSIELLRQSQETGQLWRELSSMQDPYAVHFSNAFGRDEVRLFFSAQGGERQGDGPDAFSQNNDSIGVALWSLQNDVTGIQFTPFAYNPVLARRGNLKELPELSPSVVYFQKQWLMYFSDGSIFRVAKN
ncbi:MAG: hypothetical protein IPJ88_02655 [Myxococcales bacterium]|nr:MAG: hypothetical protein IPJ88_02655 [Myxococcales bacterium]